MLCIIGLVHFDIDILLKWKFLSSNLMCVFPQVASKTGDVQLADFVETEYLGEQVWFSFDFKR